MMTTATRNHPATAFTPHAAPERPCDTPSSVPYQQDHADNVLLTGARPEGLPLEQIPAETRRLLEITLPGEGLRLLAHLLQYATCYPEQTLPAPWVTRLCTSSAQPRTLIVVRSLKALAQSSGSPCGPDRYGHLVLACEALGMLTRRVHRCGATYATVLSVALEPRALTPAVIQACQQRERRYSNPRVQRLLCAVRLRAQAALPQAAPSPSIHSLLSQMEVLVQYYEQHGSTQAPLFHLMMQMMRLLLSTPLFHEMEAEEQDLSIFSGGGPADHNGYFVQLDDRNQLAAHVSPESSGVSVSGRFVPSDRTDLSEQSNSSFTSGQDLHHESRFVPLYDKNLLASPASQTEATQVPRQMSRFVSYKGTNLASSLSINDSFSPERGNEKKKASSLIDTAGSRHYVQIPAAIQQAQSCQEQMEEQDREQPTQIRKEALHYASLLDGDTQWLGKLVQCVRQYSPSLRRLACIATLARLYDPKRSRLERPGAWFVHTCKLLAQGALQLSEEVYLWAATELDMEQIATALQQGYLAPEPEVPVPSSRTQTEPLPTAFDGSAEQGAPEQYEEQWESGATPPSSEPMDRAMAEQLAAKVRQDVASDPFPSQIELLPGKHPGYWRVLLIWKQGVEVLLDTEEEWVSYLSRVQATAEIMKMFHSGCS